MPFGRGIDAQRRACEPSFAEFAQFREGRVEPELGPPTAPRMADPTATSDRPTAGEMPGMVSEVDTEPRLFDFVPREVPPTSAPSRRAPAERPHIGSVVYLLLVGLVAAATIGVFFGIAFFLLAQPKDKTFAGAGPVSPGVEQAVSTVKGTTRAGDAPATIIASAPTAPTPGPASGWPSPPAPPPQVGPSPAAAEFAGPPGESTHRASGGRRSGAHSAARRGRSAHHYRQPAREELAAQAEKQRILSAAMDRAHHENFSDPFQSLAPPQARQRNPFDQLLTHLTGQTKPAQSLTPPGADQPDPFAQGVWNK